MFTYNALKNHFTDSQIENMVPKSMGDFISTIGLASTVELMASFGGTTLYIPSCKGLMANTSIINAIGYKQAIKLADAFSNMAVEIPKGRFLIKALRDKRVYLDSKTATRNTLVKKYDLTQRQIRAIIAKERK